MTEKQHSIKDQINLSVVKIELHIMLVQKHYRICDLIFFCFLTLLTKNFMFAIFLLKKTVVKNLLFFYSIATFIIS